MKKADLSASCQQRRASCGVALRRPGESQLQEMEAYGVGLERSLGKENRDESERSSVPCLTSRIGNLEVQNCRGE